MSTQPKITLPELEAFFDSITIPTQPVVLECVTKGDVCCIITETTVIMDCKFFIGSHLAVLKANPRNPAYMPYYYRLVKLKNILSK